MKRFAWMLVAIMAVCFYLPCYGAGDEEDIETVYTAVTPATFKKIMEKEGFAVSFDADGDIIWKQDGYKTYINFSKGNGSIMFYVQFQSKETSLEEVNQFNKKYRFGRACMPKKGSVRLEADLSFTGGVTEKNIVNFCNICKDLFQKWRQTVL